MSTALMHKDAGQILERVIAAGDLSKLTPGERTSYYSKVCDSVGLNPLTRPFEYIQLNGKLTLYARKDCTDQLRKIHRINVQIVGRERLEDVYVVTARATDPAARCDESIGVVSIGSLKGDALANALMKAETKAKRRVTLSICGLGWLDESEIETIPRAKVLRPDEMGADTNEEGEIIPPAQPADVLPIAALPPADINEPLPHQKKITRKEKLILRIETLLGEEQEEFPEVYEPENEENLELMSEKALEEMGKNIATRLNDKRAERDSGGQ